MEGRLLPTRQPVHPLAIKVFCPEGEGVARLASGQPVSTATICNVEKNNKFSALIWSHNAKFYHFRVLGHYINYFQESVRRVFLSLEMDVLILILLFLFCSRQLCSASLWYENWTNWLGILQTGFRRNLLLFGHFEALNRSKRYSTTALFFQKQRF